jgi:hypothetical protein
MDTLMKRIIILLLPWLFIIPPAIAQESKTLPNAQELKAANDSILADAYNLYLYEKIAWILEDELTNCQPATINEIAGWIPVGEGEDVVKGIFYNKDKTKALFEATYSFLTSTPTGKAAVRDLSPEEIDMINVREKVLLAVRKLDVKDLPSCPEGCTFNTEVIPIDENIYRVYWMLGTTQHGIIPFGCDFSYDCDSEGNIKGFRRYHKTYIPTLLKMDDGSPVRDIVHSHLSFCPLIAPTDIALFLLYGYEAGLSGFKVYSTAYHCVFSFDPATYVINIEQM